MSLPMLAYGPVTCNHRVSGYEVAGEEQPRIYSSETLGSGQEMDDLIYAAYRQLFNEQQPRNLDGCRFLESQLKNQQITVRDFIRELATSDSFRRWLYDCNSNYRFVQICIQRLLGRDVYSDREKLSWSIIVATKGINGFIDDLLSTDEYLNNFGDYIVPYQRRRLLPQRSVGDMPFARMSRYDAVYRDKLLKTQISAQRIQALLSPIPYLLGSLLAFAVLYWSVIIAISGS